MPTRNSKSSQTPKGNISVPLNLLTTAEKEMLKQTIKDSQAIYEKLSHRKNKKEKRLNTL